MRRNAQARRMAGIGLLAMVIGCGAPEPGDEAPQAGTPEPPKPLLIKGARGETRELAPDVFRDYIADLQRNGEHAKADGLLLSYELETGKLRNRPDNGPVTQAVTIDNEWYRYRCEDTCSVPWWDFLHSCNPFYGCGRGSHLIAFSNNEWAGGSLYDVKRIFFEQRDPTPDDPYDWPPVTLPMIWYRLFQGGAFTPWANHMFGPVPPAGARIEALQLAVDPASVWSVVHEVRLSDGSLHRKFGRGEIAGLPGSGKFIREFRVDIFTVQ